LHRLCDKLTTIQAYDPSVRAHGHPITIGAAFRPTRNCRRNAVSAEEKGRLMKVLNRISLFLLSALFSAPMLLAQAPDPCATAPASCATLIETHATSEARIPNTAVDISASVTATGKDMSEVQRTLATKSNSLLAYLKGEKVDRLITSNVSFSPQTRFDKNGPDKMVGFTGTSSVSFRTTPEKAADLLAGVLTNGGNEIESTVFTPTEKEIADARRRLSEDATKMAVEQADAIARAAGMHVVSIRNINVNDTGYSPRPMAMSGMALKAQVAIPMQTSAGEQQLSVQVNITAAATR